MSALQNRYTSSVGEYVSSTVVGLLLMIPLMFVNGFVIMKLWNWFLPLVFETVPLLSIGTAIGFALVVGYLTGNSDDPGMDPWEGLFVNTIMTVVRASLYLILGAIVHSVLT